MIDMISKKAIHIYITAIVEITVITAIYGHYILNVNCNQFIQ